MGFFGNHVIGIPDMAGFEGEDFKVHLSALALVHKEKKKVLYVEAGKHFIDALLSFLTLPLGTIARLVGMGEESIGSLTSLYGSVKALKEEQFWSPTCKRMLLHPRNSMEDHCQPLKLNIDNTKPTPSFICVDCSPSNCQLSAFENQKCSCGKVMNTLISVENPSRAEDKGFVTETATFIVFDDLHVIPNVVGASVQLLQKLGVDDVDALEKKTAHVGKKEVVELLKLSLLSKTPLTDFILNKKRPLENLNPMDQSIFDIGELPPSDEGEKKHIVVKALVRKSDRKILLAEGDEYFADLILSFLTFPLGGVLHMLKGLSSLGCNDNLYKSLNKLSSNKYIRSQELKDKLAKPPCASQFGLNSQILPIGVASVPLYYFDKNQAATVTRWKWNNILAAKKADYFRMSYVDPKSSTGESSSPRGFTRGPMYMVTDDLVVTPTSSISGISYLGRSKVPIADLEETVITIGVNEGLSILKASLTSKTALTNGLNQLTRK